MGVRIEMCVAHVVLHHVVLHLYQHDIKKRQDRTFQHVESTSDAASRTT